jgi:vacuolar iron transporter family protein
MMGRRTNRGGRLHPEAHQSGRAGWLRAAVLGSDDAIVSTASLVIGVLASSASQAATLVAGAAGLVAGSMSMAVGEYVSVSSQRDAERADIARETQELARDPQAELHELATIYRQRGIEESLALKVAEQLSAHDQLGSHMRDELGIDQASLAGIPRATTASCVDIGRQLCVLCPGAARGSSGIASRIASARRRNPFSRKPRSPRRAWRSPGRRASGSGHPARHCGRRPGHDCHCGARSAPWYAVTLPRVPVVLT